MSWADVPKARARFSLGCSLFRCCNIRAAPVYVCTLHAHMVDWPLRDPARCPGGDDVR